MNKFELSRRTFLKVLGITPVVATLPGWATGLPEVLQLYSVPAHDEFAAKGSIMLPIKLLLLTDSGPDEVQFVAPVTVNGFNINSVYRQMRVETQQRQCYIRGVKFDVAPAVYAKGLVPANTWVERIYSSPVFVPKDAQVALEFENSSVISVHWG